MKTPVLPLDFPTILQTMQFCAWIPTHGWFEDTTQPSPKEVTLFCLSDARILKSLTRSTIEISAFLQNAPTDPDAFFNGIQTPVLRTMAVALGLNTHEQVLDLIHNENAIRLLSTMLDVFWKMAHPELPIPTADSTNGSLEA
jgi:hypothetical protein